MSVERDGDGGGGGGSVSGDEDAGGDCGGGSGGGDSSSLSWLSRVNGGKAPLEIVTWWIFWLMIMSMLWVILWGSDEYDELMIYEMLKEGLSDVISIIIVLDCE